MLRRGHELAQARVGIGVELALRLRPESKVTLERVVAAVHRIVGAASRAASAGQPGIDVDPIARRKVLHQIAGTGDHARHVEPEDRRQFRQRKLGKPRLPVRQHVAQVGNEAAGLDLDQDVGRARLGHRQPLQNHVAANLVEAGCQHGFHVRSAACWV